MYLIQDFYSGNEVAFLVHVKSWAWNIIYLYPSFISWMGKKKIQINTNPKEHILPVFCFGLSGFFMLAGIGNSFTDVGNTVRQVIKLNVENCCTVQKK